MPAKFRLRKPCETEVTHLNPGWGWQQDCIDPKNHGKSNIGWKRLNPKRIFPLYSIPTPLKVAPPILDYKAHFRREIPIGGLDNDNGTKWNTRIATTPPIPGQFHRFFDHSTCIVVHERLQQKSVRCDIHSQRYTPKSIGRPINGCVDLKNRRKSKFDPKLTGISRWDLIYSKARAQNLSLDKTT